MNSINISVLKLANMVYSWQVAETQLKANFQGDTLSRRVFKKRAQRRFQITNIGSHLESHRNIFLTILMYLGNSIFQPWKCACEPITRRKRNLQPSQEYVNLIKRYAQCCYKKETTEHIDLAFKLLRSILHLKTQALTRVVSINGSILGNPFLEQRAADPLHSLGFLLCLKILFLSRRN